MTELKLREKYALAGCCKPEPDISITGYFSLNDEIRVHRSDCSNLDKTEASRLVKLNWEDVIAADDFQPEADFDQLEPLDFAVLAHHRQHDIDYSLMLAKMLNISKQDAFDRHQKLRDLGLLERVPAVMVRYRKNVAESKWIKHRNHTYYRLTAKGIAYLKAYDRR